MFYVTSYAITLQEANTILAAFSNAFNKHMFSCEFHLLVFPLLRYVLVIQSYLSFVNCFIYLFESFFDRSEKVSNKPNKVQGRGIQSPMQNTKNKVHERLLYPVSNMQP